MLSKNKDNHQSRSHHLVNSDRGIFTQCNAESCKKRERVSNSSENGPKNARISFTKRGFTEGISNESLSYSKTFFLHNKFWCKWHTKALSSADFEDSNFSIIFRILWAKRAFVRGSNSHENRISKEFFPKQHMFSNTFLAYRLCTFFRLCLQEFYQYFLGNERPP